MEVRQACNVKDLTPLESEVAFIIPARGRMSVPVQVYASPRLPLTQQEASGLEQVARLQDVARVVALPDLHVKPQLEAPSSLATATRASIVLSLSSPSPGCGMALALTPLSFDDLNGRRLDDFFAYLAQSLPLGGGWVRPRLPDIREILLTGAAAGVKLFGVDAGLLKSIERGGNALGDAMQGSDDEEILRTIPARFLPMAGRDLGYIGRGNHFFELQWVQELLDENTARQWGLRKGQVVAMYHADSGRIGSLAGRLYAHRRKNTWRGRWLEMRYKTVFHLSQLNSPADILRRGDYYFSPRRFMPIPANTREAQRSLQALALATNYAFANRIAIFAALRDGLCAVWGNMIGSPSLLYDGTHNGIAQEDFEGERLWVHRHNASRALPPGHPGLTGTPFMDTGQPLLLPGTQCSDSYLCAARPGVSASLFSVCHGAGQSVRRLGLESGGGGPLTRLYTFREGFVEARPHRTSEGIDEVLSVLGKAGLAEPVARLRPIAVMKDAAQ